MLSNVVDVDSIINDALGTTVGSWEGRASSRPESGLKYSAAALTAFGENHLTTEPPNHQTFFTGKPYVEGLGHAFWMRNYRAGLAKWQTADPMGYPDGWNQLAYCNNGVTSAVDLWGCETNVGPYWDLFESYARTAASLGDRDKLEEISAITTEGVGKRYTWNLGVASELEVRVHHDNEWFRTDKTKIEGGIVKYEEVCFDYIYKYDAILKMVKLDSPATMTIKTTGDGASVLGLAILPIPGAGLGGLVLTILGGGSVVASKVFDDVESVPYGLFFVRSMKDHKMLEPTKVPCQSRWVE